MKIIFALVLLLATSTTFAVETKKVCNEVKDQKTGKVKQQCKEIKVHKKLEGTKVPEKKK